jgi:5-methylcytosine-specific restriction endonuclease McrA
MESTDIPQEIREKVLELDKGKCCHFGCTKKGTQIHHFIPKSFEIINKLYNLGLVCDQHHDDVNMGRETNIEFLTAIKYKPDFRHQKALDWHLQRQELKIRKLKRLELD